MYVYAEGSFIGSHFVDLKGRPVKKDPFSNPYEFDDYVEWKGNYREGDSAAYSDRLSQWDNKKYKRCYNAVFGKGKKTFSVRDPGPINEFLNLYFEHEVELTAILCGCNVSSGFPYYVYYYREF